MGKEFRDGRPGGDRDCEDFVHGGVSEYFTRMYISEDGESAMIALTSGKCLDQVGEEGLNTLRSNRPPEGCSQILVRIWNHLALLRRSDQSCRDRRPQGSLLEDLLR